MKVLIFKTDIKSKKKINILKSVIDQCPLINSWSVDTEDIDNVLRVVSADKLSEKEIIKRVKTCGLYCEVLTD